jgi:hypothetical protein
MSISSFSLWFQKTPIILTHGIATNQIGGIKSLPITELTQAAAGAGQPTNLNDYLFDFTPLPGASLVDNNVALYPFANQQVAANAMIFEPLRISLLMLAPARGAGAYNQKLSIFQNLQNQLLQHVAMGGTFTVATPSFIYNECLLVSLKDVSEGDPKRPQDRWQWDFLQPLLTEQAAQAAQNALTQKLSAQNKVIMDENGAIHPSGPGPAIGNPASGVGPSVVPNTKDSTASSTRGSPPPSATTQ